MQIDFEINLNIGLASHVVYTNCLAFMATYLSLFHTLNTKLRICCHYF